MDLVCLVRNLQRIIKDQHRQCIPTGDIFEPQNQKHSNQIIYKGDPIPRNDRMER